MEKWRARDVFFSSEVYRMWKGWSSGKSERLLSFVLHMPVQILLTIAGQLNSSFYYQATK